jgi:hypothetical protein
VVYLNKLLFWSFFSLIQDLQEQLNYKTRTVLYAEVETRFSYIYRMIDSICSNSHALTIMSQTHKSIEDKVPNPAEFERLEVIIFHH